MKQLLTSLETCLHRSEAFYKKLFDWKPYNLAFKLKIVAEAEAVENNCEIAGEYGISESMVPSLEERLMIRQICSTGSLSGSVSRARSTNFGVVFREKNSR